MDDKEKEKQKRIKEVTMFVASVNEIDKFKGCPLPEYFRDAPRSTVR
tara:strand:+ start:1329 stop:1469 length:141 start_codon:yes stop_codon:yes gene_type:complete